MCTTSFRLSDPATAELTDAVRWYEQHRAGLGAERFDGIVETINLIRTHPEIGAPRPTRRPSRQLRVNRFPYNVVYRVRDDDSYVVGDCSYKSAPDYWKHRP